jgi:hypothetical protein
VKDFWSLPLQMSPQDGRAFNCWFPMLLASGARVEFANECNVLAYISFYAGCESMEALPPFTGRFHAQWRRKNPTDGWSDDTLLENTEPGGMREGTLRRVVYRCHLEDPMPFVKSIQESIEHAEADCLSAFGLSAVAPPTVHP